ncbi:MAG: ribonuclease H-like domain-containing protein [Halobacteriota archaeon]|uniref:ribonuclease H-like domain-containing protein n=1 Tax=Natronomonas sp. TaxID=2184060 RepID=UPI003974AA9B
MRDGPGIDVLAMPAATLDRLSQPAIRDAVAYFEPDGIIVPGARDARADAAARDAARDIPVIYPQLGRNTEGILHYRYVEGGDAGLHEATKATPPRNTIDVLALQTADLLPRLQSQLETGARETGGEAATFVMVPGLSVEVDTTALSTTLPHSDELAELRTKRKEPVTVLAGGQPAEYHHVWSLPFEHASVNVPIAGLGASGHQTSKLAQYTCTASGTIAAEAVDDAAFGLRALHGVGLKTEQRLLEQGCHSPADVRNLAVEDLSSLPGIGRTTADKLHMHAEVIASGEPLLLSNKTPVKTRENRPPLCLDTETDGLSPTIIWQIGVYDPMTDRYQSFVEREDPSDPGTVLGAFMTWFLATHADRTVLTWNGYRFDYPLIEQFLRQHHPKYVEAWDQVWTYDLYKWAVRDGNALLPGRTNQLDHVARALGYEDAGTGVTGAQTAAAYQRFMRNPKDPAAAPDWERHERYCEDDCRALWHVYEATTEAERRDVTDSGAGGAAGQQSGLTDF